jgi:hypothetical protein
MTTQTNHLKLPILSSFVSGACPPKPWRRRMCLVVAKNEIERSEIRRRRTNPNLSFPRQLVPTEGGPSPLVWGAGTQFYKTNPNSNSHVLGFLGSCVLGFLYKRTHFKNEQTNPNL